MSDKFNVNKKIFKNALIVSGVVSVVGIATLINQKVAQATADAAAQVVAQTAAQVVAQTAAQTSNSNSSSNSNVDSAAAQLELAIENQIRSILDNPNIYDNIFIENINMSNISIDNAKDMLEEVFPTMSNITLTYGETEFVITPNEIGLYYGINDAINEAFNLAREGTDDYRLQTLEKLETDNANFYVDLNYDTALIKSKLEEISKKVYVAVKEPTINKSGSSFSMSGGSNGIYMDVDATFNDIMNIIEDPNINKVAITTGTTYPKTTQENVNKMGDVLGTFTTTFTNNGSSDSGRVTNIKLASNNINGVTIAPGSTFSTNAEFGPTTQANGFQLGGAYLNGEVVQSYGGGVCQVSSTLYMAVLHSELQIVERQNHSMPVSYIGYGYDATLAGNYIDLKFKNNTNAPIYVESYTTSSNQVVCTIYGYDERSASRTIKFENTMTSNTDTGFTYQVHKLIYNNGQFVDKVHINTSYYKKSSTSSGPTTTAQTTEYISTEPITEATTESIADIINQPEVNLEDLTLIAFEDLLLETTTQIITEAPTIATTQQIFTEASTIATTQQIFTEAPTETTTMQTIIEVPIETTTMQTIIEVPIETTTQEFIPSIPEGIPDMSDMLDSEDDEVI